MDKISKLKKLLNINDEYITIHGLEIKDQLYEVEDEVNVDKTNKLFFERHEDQKIKKPTSMVVKPVIKEEDDYIYINDSLPKIPFSMINCGCRGAGKSTNTLFLLDTLDSYFDEVFIFSPTIELDVKYKVLFDKLDREFEFGKNIFIEYNESILSSILRKIKRVNKNKPFKDKVRVLMVFDDIICSLPKQQRKTIFNKLLLNNRHYNVSIIINSQSFKLFDTSLRKNCSQIVLYRTDNMSELRNYYEEYGALLGMTFKEQRENFLKIYNYATQDPHSFLYINTHNRPNIFFKNLDEQINVSEIIKKPLDTYLPDILKNKPNKKDVAKNSCGI